VVVVLLGGQRPAELAEQPDIDLAEDRLVVRERAVEVEEDGPDAQVSLLLLLACRPVVSTAARAELVRPERDIAGDVSAPDVTIG
jgi:hypothetical protein